MIHQMPALTPPTVGNSPFSIVRISSIAKSSDQKISAADLDDTTVIHYSIPNVQEFGSGTLEEGSSISSDKLLISRATVLISKLNPRKQAIARVGKIEDHPIVASTEFVPLATGSTEADRFLEYYLRSTPVTALLDSLTESATRSHQRVEPRQILAMGCPWPDAATRTQILDYLDHETAEIDAFIADLGSAAELLEEEWSARLISLVQTGARDSGTAPTGIDIWPTAPTHWTRARLKSLMLDDTNGAWGSEPGEDEVTRRCIRVADFDKLRGIVHDRNVTDRSYPRPQVKNLELRPGDLIIEKSGGGPTTPVGNVVLYSGEGGDMYSNFVARIRLRRSINPEYALRVHQAMHLSGVTARSVKQTTGIQNLDAAAYFDEPLFLPPREDQDEIASVLRLRRDGIDSAQADIARAIDLAKERRAALITAAVTGQIDVTHKQRPVVEQLQDDLQEQA